MEAAEDWATHPFVGASRSPEKQAGNTGTGIRNRKPGSTFFGHRRGRALFRSGKIFVLNKKLPALYIRKMIKDVLRAFAVSSIFAGTALMIHALFKASFDLSWDILFPSQSAEMVNEGNDHSSDLEQHVADFDEFSVHLRKQLKKIRKIEKSENLSKGGRDVLEKMKKEIKQQIVDIDGKQNESESENED